MKALARIVSSGRALLALALVLAVVVAVNVIAGLLGLRLDLTQERIYTLSSGTRQVLKALPRPVTLKFYFNDRLPEVPMQLKQYGRRVEDLLQEYRIASGGRVAVEKYNPEPDTDAEEWAQKYGVGGQSLGFMGPTLYLGLVAVSDETEAVLPGLDPRAENLLEYNVTRLLTQVTASSKPVLGVLSSLPVLGAETPFPMPGQPPDQRQPWVALNELKQTFDVRRLEPTVESIDPEISTLVVIHPKELNAKTQFAIDQFVLRGGKLLAFVDPFCIAEAETQPASPMGFSPKSSNLERLFGAWGVTFDTSKVLADIDAATRVRMGQGNQVDDNPVWLSLVGERLNRKDALTAQLEMVMLPYAGTFAVDPASGLEVTPLITSSERAGPVDAMSAQFGLDGVRREFKSGMKSLNLAVRLHGKLKTAFPEGKPAGEPAPGETAPPPPSPDPGAALTESVGACTIVLVGDVDLLFDRFCVQEMNFFGQRAFQPMNDNLALFANMVEQMAGNEALIAVRTRGQTERPLTAVRKLERQAQEQFYAQERQLQERLETAQRNLAELQSKKDKSQRFILSPQQKAEIDNFQQQVVKAKQELKMVRRKLRARIERLGAWVKALNVLALPLLVAVAGVSFGMYRYGRSRA